MGVFTHTRARAHETETAEICAMIFHEKKKKKKNPLLKSVFRQTCCFVLSLFTVVVFCCWFFSCFFFWGGGGECSWVFSFFFFFFFFFFNFHVCLLMSNCFVLATRKTGESKSKVLVFAVPYRTSLTQGNTIPFNNVLRKFAASSIERASQGRCALL